MRIISLVAVAIALVTAEARAQSLFVVQGERAAEGSVAWSVGPFSQGVELHGALSLGGRWDIGFGVNRYNADLRRRRRHDVHGVDAVGPLFLVQGRRRGTPVSVAAHAQYFHDDYGGIDSGWYVLAGAESARSWRSTDSAGAAPLSSGFSFAGESFRFGGATPDRSVYLTRQFGVHAQFALGASGWLRFTRRRAQFPAGNVSRGAGGATCESSRGFCRSRPTSFRQGFAVRRA